MPKNTIGDRLAHAWNAFTNNDSSSYIHYEDNGPSYSSRPDRPRLLPSNEKSIVASIYNRVAVDASAFTIIHAKVNEDDQYVSDMDSSLNDCLTLDANLDQTGRALIQDIVLTLFDEGCVAIVPTDSQDNIGITELRAGKIIQWFPQKVKVHLWDENKGKFSDIILNKRNIAIIENPYYSIMNEPNSTAKRLTRCLNRIDVIDDQLTSNKLNMIVSIPYSVESTTQKNKAEKRRKDIENQLTDNKYGIAYIDGTEKLTQLNRPIENNLLGEAEYLTSMLYSQLGITESILNGSTDTQTLLNYYNNTVEPVVSAIVLEMKRKFLTKTAITQRQSILYFKDPFKMIPIGNIADIADKFTRNEILTGNEVRSIIGRKPSSDPNANILRNKNINAPTDETSKPQIETGIDTNVKINRKDKHD